MSTNIFVLYTVMTEEKIVVFSLIPFSIRFQTYINIGTSTRFQRKKRYVEILLVCSKLLSLLKWLIY